MSIKISFKKEIHIYRGEISIENLQEYIKNTYQILKTAFNLYFIDQEGDEITISRNQDLEVAQQLQKNIKIYVQELEQPIKEQESQEDFEKIELEQQQLEKENLENQEKMRLENDRKAKIEQIKEEKRKRKQEFIKNLKEKKEKLYERAKHDENLSKKMKKCQKKVQKFLPQLQEFLEKDFTYQGPDSNQQQQQDNNQNQFKDITDMLRPKFKKLLVHFKLRKDCKQQEKKEQPNRCQFFQNIRCAPMKNFNQQAERLEKFLKQQQQQESQKEEQVQKEEQEELKVEEKQEETQIIQKQEEELEIIEKEEEKPQFSQSVIQKAQNLCEILGGQEEQYYQTCQDKKQQNIHNIINDLIDQQ